MYEFSESTMNESHPRHQFDHLVIPRLDIAP